MLPIAGLLGISTLRLIIYTLAIAAVIGAGIAVRQHYVNLGWHKAITAVKKQDDRAVDAANKVQEQVAKCDETNGFWDVITQDCRLQEQEEKK